ncbi:MAG: FixH family protein [Betaproteobacteria bacterium]|nr:FixH family protein [Betaproteobacteria bacterium]
MTPWYKEPWPWIVMAPPAAAVLAGIATLWIAVASADGLVADDYYKRGLAVNAVTRREQAAERRGIAAQFEREAGRLRVRLHGDAPAALLLKFVHATRAGHDLHLRLEPAGAGVYEAALPQLAAGRWRLILEDPRGEWRIVKEEL